jgi:tetratricopeptide (TPR) repeat protein
MPAANVNCRRHISAQFSYWAGGAVLLLLIGGGAGSVQAVEPEAAVARMRELLAQRQPKELVAEFGPIDLRSWPAAAVEKTIAACELRGRAYLFVKDGRRAEADLRHALELAPENVVLRLTLGENYFRNLNDDAQALQAFGEVRQRLGASHGWQNLTAAVFRAQILTDGLQADQAIAELESLGEADKLPASWRIKVLRAYGHAYASQGREAEALARFREALQIEADAQRPAAAP